VTTQTRDVTSVRTAPADVRSTGVSLIDAGVPGASLQRAYERLLAERAARVRTRHPRLGALMLAFTREPRDARHLHADARRQDRAAAALVANAGPAVALLFDRSLARTGRTGAIDILAVGPAGVFVIDVQRAGDASTTAAERSASPISGADVAAAGTGRSSNPVDRLTVRADAIREILAARGATEVPVHLVYCQLDGRHRQLADLGAAGVEVVEPRAAADLVGQPGSFGQDCRAMLWIWLTQALPAA
jgi:hypothetical protein